MNQEKKRKTAGQEAVDIFQKGDRENSPIELQREMTREYYQNLIDCVLDGRKKFRGRFFIVVITKNERILSNVFRNYFLARSSCPTPDYDQSVFKYDHRTEEIEYIWTIPSQDACFHLHMHANEVVKEEQHLLSFVLDFMSGRLLQIAKKLNKERDKDSFLIDKGEAIS